MRKDFLKENLDSVKRKIEEIQKKEKTGISSQTENKIEIIKILKFTFQNIYELVKEYFISAALYIMLFFSYFMVVSSKINVYILNILTLPIYYFSILIGGFGGIILGNIIIFLSSIFGVIYAVFIFFLLFQIIFSVVIVLMPFVTSFMSLKKLKNVFFIDTNEIISDILTSSLLLSLCIFTLDKIIYAANITTKYITKLTTINFTFTPTGYTDKATNFLKPVGSFIEAFSAPFLLAFNSLITSTNSLFIKTSLFLVLALISLLLVFAMLKLGNKFNYVNIVAVIVAVLVGFSPLFFAKPNSMLSNISIPYEHIGVYEVIKKDKCYAEGISRYTNEKLLSLMNKTVGYKKKLLITPDGSICSFPVNEIQRWSYYALFSSGSLMPCVKLNKLEYDPVLKTATYKVSLYFPFNFINSFMTTDIIEIKKASSEIEESYKISYWSPIVTFAIPFEKDESIYTEELKYWYSESYKDIPRWRELIGSEWRCMPKHILVQTSTADRRKYKIMKYYENIYEFNKIQNFYDAKN